MTATAGAMTKRRARAARSSAPPGRRRGGVGTATAWAARAASSTSQSAARRRAGRRGGAIPARLALARLALATSTGRTRAALATAALATSTGRTSALRVSRQGRRTTCTIAVTGTLLPSASAALPVSSCEPLHRGCFLTRSLPLPLPPSRLPTPPPFPFYCATLCHPCPTMAGTQVHGASRVLRAHVRAVWLWRGVSMPCRHTAPGRGASVLVERGA